MKSVLVGLFLYCVSSAANAGIMPVDTSKWLQFGGPSNDRNTGTWIGLKGQAPEKKGNSSGALVSDFVVEGDFTYSGYASPTSTEFDDNDIIGLVFGWKDQQNHYRLGWTQNQRPGTNDDQSYADITGRTGLFLIQEIDGVSKTLFNIADLFWEDDSLYNFEINRDGDFFNIMFGDASFSYEDAAFINGQVGIYTESQTARFGELNVVVPDKIIATVAEPAGIVMLLSGLLLLCAAPLRSRLKS